MFKGFMSYDPTSKQTDRQRFLPYIYVYGIDAGTWSTDYVWKLLFNEHRFDLDSMSVQIII